MKRVALLLCSLLVATLPGTASFGAHSVKGDWNQAGFDAANTHNNRYEDAISPLTIGRLFPGYNLADTAAGAPTIVGGRVYVAGPHAVSSRNAFTGALDWSYAPAGSTFQGDVVVADKVVYAISGQGGGTFVVALTATSGHRRWRLFMPFLRGRGLSLADGLLFVPTSSGATVAVDVATHEGAWTFASNGRPAVTDGRAYVSGADGNLYALDVTDGSVEWSYPIDDIIESSPSVANGVVYIGTRHGTMYAIDAADGHFRWSYATGAAGVTDAAVAHEKVYFGTHSGDLYALNAATGGFAWKFHTAKPIVLTDPVVANGIVFASSYDKYIYALDGRTGDPLWSYRAGGAAWSNVVVSNGFVFAGFPSGHLRQFLLGP